jgi:hypothetical protein
MHFSVESPQFTAVLAVLMIPLLVAVLMGLADIGDEVSERLSRVLLREDLQLHQHRNRLHDHGLKLQQALLLHNPLGL